MKKIKSFSDIEKVIDGKYDIYDDLKCKITFINLLYMKLIDVHIIIQNGEYTYNPE